MKIAREKDIDQEEGNAGKWLAASKDRQRQTETRTDRGEERQTDRDKERNTEKQLLHVLPYCLPFVLDWRMYGKPCGQTGGILLFHRLQDWGAVYILPHVPTCPPQGRSSLLLTPLFFPKPNPVEFRNYIVTTL